MNTKARRPKVPFPTSGGDWVHEGDTLVRAPDPVEQLPRNCGTCSRAWRESPDSRTVHCGAGGHERPIWVTRSESVYGLTMLVAGIKVGMDCEAMDIHDGAECRVYKAPSTEPAGD